MCEITNDNIHLALLWLIFITFILLGRGLLRYLNQEPLPNHQPRE